MLQTCHPTLDSKSEKFHQTEAHLCWPGATSVAIMEYPLKRKPPHSLKGLALWHGPHQETHTRMNTCSTSCAEAYPPNLADLEFVQFGLYQVHVVPVHGPSPKQDAHSHPLLWHLTLDFLQMLASQEAAPICSSVHPSFTPSLSLSCYLKLLRPGSSY